VQYVFSPDDYLRDPERYHEYYHAGFEAELCKLITIESELIDQSGKILSTARYRLYNSITFSSARKQASYYTRERDYDLYRIETLPFTGRFVFNDVSVDDLTDDVYIRIKSINGIDIETAMGNGYINISVTEKDLRFPRYRFRAD
jgi:hypothetical protein